MAWEQPPEGTESLVVTAFDVDAPILGGLWHWIVQDVPASTRGLDAGAGTSDETLPASSTHRPNSLGTSAWAGVKPPAGTGVHRLVVCVTALRVPRLEAPDAASPALVQIAMIEHTLGRAVAVATSQAPPA